MTCFHPLFNEKIIERALQGPEGPFFDVKTCLYKLDDEAKQGEFVRDLIAFGNTARRTGKPCYIVFGITDTERRFATPEECKGLALDKQFPGRKKPKGWDNPNVALASKMVDGVQKVLQEVAEKWVEPKPEFCLVWGEYEGHFVSYLEIEPPKERIPPYKLKRGFKNKRGKLIEAGAIFMRYGASTQRWDKPYHPPSQFEAPYLSQKEWLALRERYLQEPFLACADWLNRFPLYDQQERELLPLLLDLIALKRHKIIRVSGVAGSGKSMLLRALAHKLAAAIEIGAFPDEIPLSPIPVYVEMGRDLRSPQMFERLIRAHISEHTYPLEAFFRIPDVQWVLLLDGLDEIHDWEQTLSWLPDWLEGWPSNVFCVLSARPYIWQMDTRGPVFHLRELSPEEAYALFQKRIEDFVSRVGNEDDGEIIQEAVSTFWKKMREFPEFLTLLTRPRAIDALLEFFGISPNALTTPLLEGSPGKQVKKHIASSIIEIFQKMGVFYPRDSEKDIYDEVQGLIFGKDDIANEEEEIIEAQAEGLSPDEEPTWTFFTLSRYVVDYFWEKEKEKKYHLWGVFYTFSEELDNTRDFIQELAWNLPWNSLHFERRLLNGVAKFYGERVGVLEPDAVRSRERFSSPLMRWIEAAEKGFNLWREVLRSSPEEDGLIQQEILEIWRRWKVLYQIKMRFVKGWRESSYNAKRIADFLDDLLLDAGYISYKGWKIWVSLLGFRRLLPRRFSKMEVTS